MAHNKKFDVTLKAVTKESKVNSIVILEPGATTLISEEKTLYHCVDPKEAICKSAKGFASAVANAKYDLNVDLDSVVSLYDDKDSAFQVYVEAIMFAKHCSYVLKGEVKENDSCKKYELMFDEKYQSVLETSQIKMEHVNFARDLQDMPPNVATSVEVANLIEKKAKEIKEIKVTVLGKKEAEQHGMGLFLSVNAGSHVDPRVVILEYVTDPSLPRTVLVGKGITFDSGGYNLKPSTSLIGMKFDMSGSAIVSSTVIALAKAKAKCNVVSVAMLTDNRIGGHATLTESVVKSMNGKTVEIGNTDAEGRLVLADGMTYAVRNLKADRLMTVATLTGAMIFSLGRWFTGSFTNDETFHSEFMDASKKAHEPLWQLPLTKDHLEVMKCSKIADLSNLGSIREAGSSTAAAFLNVFAEEKPYIHLDIALTADSDNRGNAPMLKSMFELLKK
ncbi:leucyl aminopeptidase [Spiroplasma helicoides]|uniref:Probable cytosol aminopeptidase n=1 Tax=Spiroplasma helicoides TaxID=216938 RepID=A0A1B3SM67_9MOLU|nr:M17 family metallopeptidase [Spiroplasma helicoides]AOG61025.1 leucyl aminopeptidase [Spiroplasma helicoides]